jgi:hypothetical protein
MPSDVEVDDPGGSEAAQACVGQQISIGEDARKRTRTGGAGEAYQALQILFEERFVVEVKVQ